MHNATRKAVLIVRVSDPKQEKEGLSLDNQEQSLRAYAQDHDFSIDREFRFQESADLKLRRRFHEMVSYVKSRGDVVAIIGYRVDRLTRNYHDHVLLDELRLNSGKELHFVHDRLVIAPRTVGRNIAEWDTKVYLAKSYLNRLKEDAFATLEYKLSHGEWPGKAPFGYRNVKRNEKSWVEVFEPEAIIVRRMYSLYGSGSHSMEKVRQAIKTEFSVDVSKGKLDHILRNPFYMGLMLLNGVLYRHTYEPIVSSKVYDQVQRNKRGHHKQSFKFAGLDFPFRGLIKCSDCGCRITGEQKKRRGRTYRYYHCTQYFGHHNAPWVNESDIDGQFLKLLKTLAVPNEKVDELEAAIHGSAAQAAAALAAKRSNLESEKKKLIARLEAIYEDKLDGVLDQGSYRERRDKYQSALDKTEEQLKGLAVAQVEQSQAAISVLRLCSLAHRAYSVSKADEKHAILKTLLSDTQLKGKRLVWKLKKPFDTVFDSGVRQIWLPLVDTFRNSNLEVEVDLHELEIATDAIERVLARRDDADAVLGFE